MCTWLYKPKNVEMVDDEEILSMYTKNPDGIGIAYTFNGTVKYAKGFMTFKEFKKYYDLLKYKIDLKKEAVLLHCRITTTKSKTPQQCHPFIITTNDDELNALKGSCDLIFAHNGSMKNFYSFDTKKSDTQNFSIRILAKMQELDENFYKNSFFQKWIEELTQDAGDKYNRLVFMNKDGDAFFIGDVVKKDNGLVYANENHKTKENYLKVYYTSKYYSLMPINATSLALNDGDIVQIMYNDIVEDVVTKQNSETVYWINTDNKVFIEDYPIENSDKVFVELTDRKVLIKRKNSETMYKPTWTWCSNKYVNTYTFNEDIVI